MKANKKIEYISITAEVLPETAETLARIQSNAGLPLGEQIDRMVLEFHPRDSVVASYLILEEFVKKTIHLSDDECLQTIHTVLTELQKSIPEDIPAKLLETLKSMNKELETLGYKLP